MSMFRRWIVLILVALALPLQAVAAAAMLHCGPADGGALHGHAAVAGDDVHGLAHGAGHAHDAMPDDDGQAAAVAAGHACSACAVCCTLAGAPATRLCVPAPERMPAARPDGTPFAAMFLTSGVERPPRG